MELDETLLRALLADPRKPSRSARVKDFRRQLIAGQRIEIRDDLFPHLLMRVLPRKGKAPRIKLGIRYRIQGERPRLEWEYPLVSLAEARIRAQRALLAVAEGRDPAAELREKLRVKTVAQIAEEFLGLYDRRLAAGQLTEPYVKERRRHLEKEILPLIGRKRVDNVGFPELRRLTEDIDASGRPYLANYVAGTLHLLFDLAVRRGYIPISPATRLAGFGLPAHSRRNRVLDAKEIGLFWKACEEEPSLFGVAFRVLLLTAQRPNEIFSMRWDLLGEDGWYLLPKSKTRDEHRIYLAPETLELLEPLRRTASGPWVFPSVRRNRDHILQPGAAITRIREASGLRNWRVYPDLKKTAGSYMSAMGVERHVVSIIMGHQDRGVTSIYDRYRDLPKARQAWERWSTKAVRIAHGEKADILEFQPGSLR